MVRNRGMFLALVLVLMGGSIGAASAADSTPKPKKSAKPSIQGGQNVGDEDNQSGANGDNEGAEHQGRKKGHENGDDKGLGKNGNSGGLVNKAAGKSSASMTKPTNKPTTKNAEPNTQAVSKGSKVKKKTASI